MIIDMADTTTTAVNKKLDALRERVGVVAMGRVLTLIIAPDSEEILEESLKAANNASHELPSRIIVTMRGNPYADKPRLDAQLRAGGDTGASEVWVTHGREEALVRWCELEGIAARPLHLVGYEDEAD